MTEIKKAIKFAENEITRLEFAPILNECEMTESWREQINVWKVAKLALEKQIPKKLEEYIENHYCCPACKSVQHPASPYCEFCGQALNWGDRE